jgi:hypothetical protein
MIPYSIESYLAVNSLDGLQGLGLGGIDELD